jgi:hypothetical protein
VNELQLAPRGPQLAQDRRSARPLLWTVHRAARALRDSSDYQKPRRMNFGMRCGMVQNLRSQNVQELPRRSRGGPWHPMSSLQLVLPLVLQYSERPLPSRLEIFACCPDQLTESLVDLPRNPVTRCTADLIHELHASLETDASRKSAPESGLSELRSENGTSFPQNTDTRARQQGRLGLMTQTFCELPFCF